MSIIWWVVLWCKNFLTLPCRLKRWYVTTLQVLYLITQLCASFPLAVTKKEIFQTHVMWINTVHNSNSILYGIHPASSHPLLSPPPLHLKACDALDMRLSRPHLSKSSPCRLYVCVLCVFFVCAFSLVLARLPRWAHPALDTCALMLHTHAWCVWWCTVRGSFLVLQ